MPRRVVVLIGGVLILAALGTALISGIIRAPNMGPPSDLPTLPPQRSESPTAVPTIAPNRGGVRDSECCLATAAPNRHTQVLQDSAYLPGEPVCVELG